MTLEYGPQLEKPFSFPNVDLNYVLISNFEPMHFII